MANQPKCCTCRKPNPNGPVFHHEHDPFNKYNRFRKSVYWCQPCWDQYLEDEKRYKAQEIAENEREIIEICEEMGKDPAPHLERYRETIKKNANQR